MWPFHFSVLTWIAVAFVAAVLEISVPHFGSAFVSAGAVAAAIAAWLGFGMAIQFAIFVVVLTVSLVTLRSGLVGKLAGAGCSVAHRPADRPARARHARHRSDDRHRPHHVGGEDWAASSREAIAIGTKVRVVGADGIVLEVTRE